MRYKLRTLLILLAVSPPVLAWLGWPALQWLNSRPNVSPSLILLSDVHDNDDWIYSTSE